MTSIQKALSHPQNLEAIASFLPKQEKQDLTDATSNMASHYRYPFRGILDTEISSVIDAFEKVGCNPLYLWEIDPTTGHNPVFSAFLENRFILVDYFIQSGGRLAVTPLEKAMFRGYWTSHIDYPHLAGQIRNLKWEMAKTKEDKSKIIEWVLEECCHKRNLTGLHWALQKAKEAQIPIPLYRSLQLATQGGFETVYDMLFSSVGFSRLTQDEKEALVLQCVDMGYSSLLLLMKNKYGFPVKADILKEMTELLKCESSRMEYIHFPEAASSQSHQSHGGNDNYEMAEREYTSMVAYALFKLRNGGNIRDLIDNLMHKRLRMAVLCKRNHLAHYGKPTSESMETLYGNAYRKYGERIRAKYPHLPHQVTVQIGDHVIPMTQFCEDRWVHPDGTHSEIILDEVARLAETLRKPGHENRLKPLAKIIWLISHYPPCERGTPIVLRALVDALCLCQITLPIDKAYEINCDALTYDDPEEFAIDFAEKIGALIQEE